MTNEELENKVKKRIAELKDSLVRIQNNANAHIGAIGELEAVLKPEVKKEEEIIS